MTTTPPSVDRFELLQLASLVTQEDAFFSGITEAVEKNVATMRARFHDQQKNSVENAVGVIDVASTIKKDGLAYIDMRTHCFYAQSWGFARGLAMAAHLPISVRTKADIITISDYCYLLVVAIFGGADGVFDVRRAARETLAVGTVTNGGPVLLFPDFKQMAAANDRHLPPLPPDNLLRKPDSNEVLDMDEPDNPLLTSLPVLARAVRDGSPGSCAAWHRVGESMQMRGKSKVLDDYFGRPFLTRRP